MRLQEVFPYQVCVNLRDREDRRREAWSRFAAAGLEVDRQPGIPKEWVKDSWGFMNPSRYACSLAKRLAIRRAKLAGAPAVLLFEDDVVLAPDLHERLAEIELPEDWGIFFLGCKHLARPVPFAPGLVRVSRAADHHAMAIRAEYFNAAIRGLAGYSKGSPPKIRYSDVKMSEIQAQVPTYAAFPNLAWQALSFSNNAGSTQSHYDLQGRQRTQLHAVAGLECGMANLRLGLNREGADTITEADRPDLESVSLTSQTAKQFAPAETTVRPAAMDDEPPGLWFLNGEPARHRLEDLFQMRAFINLGRREDRRAEVEYQFALQHLAVERFAAIDGQWVRRTRGHGKANQYACRLSHRMVIRRAKLRGCPAVLIFEDDAVLHPDFRRLAEALEPPEDWGVLFFGCTHVRSPEVVAPGWVRVNHVWSLHAYAVSEKCYDALLKALRAEGCPEEEQGADVILSRLSAEIPMYAVYPNIAWQDEGYSDLMGIERKPFRADGHQNRLLHVLRETNSQMKECIAAEYGEEALEPSTHGLLRPREGFRSASPLDRKWSVEKEFPLSLCLNLEEREDRRTQVEERFRKGGLDVHWFPAVKGTRSPRGGDLSPGAYGCSLSHALSLRMAHRKHVDSVLIFEDDVMFAAKAREWMESIPLPKDWGILYLGCQHVSPPEPVCRGLVEVTGAYSTHAYAVRAPHFKRLSEAIRKGASKGLPCDVVLSEMQKEIPTYAFYPNLAWQHGGHSDVKNADVSSYGKDGVQRWQQNVLLAADKKMRSISTMDMRTTNNPGLKLHLGCQHNRIEGWENLDYPDVDICKPLRWSDESAQFIFLEHVIEHVPPPDAYRFLEEAWRVLVPGGVLRLAFPDVIQIARMANNSYLNFVKSHGYGDGTHGSAVKAIVTCHGHLGVWSADTMRVVLESVGFIVEIREPGISRISELRNLEHHCHQIGDEFNRIETICLDAMKPEKTASQWENR